VRHITEKDEIRVVRLLESMRDLEAPVRADLEMSVFARLHSLGRPRSWNPVLTLREFGLSAAAAIAMMVLATTALLTLTSPQWLSAPTAALKGLGKLLSALGGALWDIAGAAARILLGIAAKVSERAPYLDNSFSWAAQAALLVFGAMLVLTVLVVFHEARNRRLAG